MTGRSREPDVETPHGRREPVGPAEARAQARLQVALDRRKGRETPAWIVELAES